MNKIQLDFTSSGEVNYGAYYDNLVEELVEKFRINHNHAGCYLVNFENDYYCHTYNGGCPDIEICRKIEESKRNKDETLD